MLFLKEKYFLVLSERNRKQLNKQTDIIMEKTITKRRANSGRNVLLLTVMLALFSFGKLIAQPLSGTYTVGTGGNYGTISAALTALSTNGVSGPVTMNILPGTYSTTTTISIGAYTGVSATNPLVFDGGNASTTTITGAVASGAVVAVNLAKYVTVKNLTITNTNAGSCSGVGIIGNATSNVGTGTTISKCIVNLPNVGSFTSAGIMATAAASGYATANATWMDSVNVDSNTINGGYYGIYFYNTTTVSGLRNAEMKFRGNTLNNIYYYGMYIYSMQNGIDIIGNTLNMASTSYYGIYCYYNYNHFAGHNPTRMIGNKIYNTAYSVYYYYNTALSSNPAQIFNNVIVGRPGVYNYGFYHYNGSAYTGNSLMYNNTVKCLGSTYGYGIYYYNNTAGGSISCMNNNFIYNTTSSGYYAAYFSTNPTNPAGGQAVNNNNYYMSGASAPNLVYRGGAYTTSTYLGATIGGDSSYNLLPSFASTGFDGHLADGCNPKGSPIGSFYVPTDMDGQTRATYPLIGADEFVGVNDNVKAVALLNPTMPISSGYTDLKVLVKNVGTNTVSSMSIAYTNNAGTPVVQTYSGTLAPCDTVSILFTGANQINLGSSNAIKVYTYLPNSNPDGDPTNDTISVTYKAPLNGLYTVGAGGNYPNPIAAAADLANGVSGPVKFKVLPGTYTGQVVINGPIAGASAVNNVLWEGDTASTRIITASVGSQAAFLINGASYVSLRNLTVNNTAIGATGIAIVGSGANANGSSCSISKCIVNMANSTSTAYGIAVTATVGGFGLTNHNMDSITIDSNVVNYGYYGIGVYGNTIGNASYNRNFKVRGNTVNNPYYYGIYMYYIYNAVDALNNTVVFAPGNSVGYGIYMYYCYNTSAIPTRFIGNRVDGAAYGSFYTYMLTGTAPVDIFNNVSGRTNYGYNYGMYLYASSSTNCRFLHNTLTQDFAQTAASYAPLVAYFPSNAIVKNNIFANTAATGTQNPVYMYSAPTATNSVNYNVYWCAANTNAIYRGSQFSSTTFNTPSAGGDSSFFVNPKFISNTNLQVGTCFTGVDMSAIVPTDINNVVRNVPPKIGGYENTTPLSYVSSSAVQMIGAVAPGSTDFPVLRIPVAYTGCGNGVNTSFYFNTIGTTTASNISAAKLYSTGISSGFNTSKLIGTVYSPSGQFNFAVTDTVNRNVGDTVNYWLAYDVSGSATNGNFLDARVDSIQTLGAYKVPTNNDPTGYLTVTAPMTYLSSTASHPTNQYATPNSTNNQILRIRVITSSIGSPIAVTSFSLNTTGGGVDTSNIVNAKLYYTGNSNTFATTTLFGSYTPTGLTTAAWLPYVITGSQQLTNDTNNFWLTYDTKATAVVGDSIDAEVTAILVNAVSQTPTVTAPAGMRKIRNDYCPSSATSAADEEIWNVTIGTMNNTSSCTTLAPGPGSVQNWYSNYTTSVAAPTIPAGIATPFSVLTSSCGGNYTSFLVIYIDYNQDGLFTGTGEQVYTSGSFTGSTAGVLKTGSITVPCTALQGITRMRVIYVETSAAPASCGTYTWGETEDYNINIVNGPATFTSTTAMQITGSTSAGASDVPVLRVPVKVTASPCNPGVITEFDFNTVGTTSTSDIVAAKLYKTSGATFGISNLLGTVYSPSGNFTFYVNDTTVNDTNNYWLAYDISSSALNANVVDARFDSAIVFGTFRTPVVSNPTGNRIISVPMTYITSSASHPDLSNAEPNSVNNKMLKIMVVGSSTGSPITVSQFALSTNFGGNDALNIANAKIYYTGNSSTFATTTQFGTTYTTATPTTGSWLPYTISGSQGLATDTNYFWLTYDLKAGAVLLDSVDAEVTAITVGGTSQTPTVTAPAGNRKIRAQYCASTATLSGDEDIFGVQFGSLNNTSGCTTVAPGPGSVNQYYANYTTSVAAPNIPSGIPTPITVTKGTCGGFYGEVVAVYIDYNQDGLFTGTGENAFTSTYATGTTGAQVIGNITIPCTATPGITRMRIVYVEGTSAPSCGTYGWGETEDYNINIVNGPATYTSSLAIQQTGSVMAGSTDVPILRVPVKVSASPCNPNVITEAIFSTTGTSTVSNIVSAKLYKTAGSTFATTNLLGTVYAPSGQFTFYVNDTAVNDTNSYWLAYDVSSSASNGSTLDAKVDSFKVFGNYVIPASNNPTGNVLVTVPMTYVSSTTTHTDLSKVETGSSNNQMMRILVVTSATGAPIAATAFDFSTTGSAAPTTNISNGKLWYTGSSATYTSPVQVGSTVTSPNGTFSFTGSQNLGNGNNYFWLTYDIPTGANLGDSVDATISNITVATVSQTPTVTAPAGSRLIRAPYCISAATSTGDEEIINVSVGSFSNASGCTTLAPGAGSSVQLYGNYTGIAGPSLKRGDYATVNVTLGTCGGFYGEVVGVYIDYNQNGLFDAGETCFTSAYATGTANQVIPCTFLVPMNAPLGATRLRIVYVEGTSAPACGTYTWGETEDYTVTIGEPTYDTYTWTGTTSTVAGVATNWTPNRVTPNMTDKLIFNSTTPISVTAVPTAISRVVQLTANTKVTVAGTAANVISVSDTLNLGTGSKFTTGSLVLATGLSAAQTGVITGSGKVYGSLQRWFSSTSGAVNFPLTDTGYADRSVSVNYTTFPLTAGTVTSSFIVGAPGNTGLPYADIAASLTANRVGENGYWSMSTDMGAGTYTGTYNATGFKGVNNYAQLMLINRANSSASWTSNGTHVTTTGSNAAPVLSRSSATAFGDFGVGGDSTTNPLPVNMLFFNAINVNGDVQLKWATANEINNKGFAVERSMDGANFKEIGFVKGNGTTTTTNAYASIDAKAFLQTATTTLYYRLRQVDFDGNFEYSNIVMVNESDLNGDVVNVYPNPFVSTVGVNIQTSEATTAKVELVDMQGRVISTELVKVANGGAYHEVKGTNNLSSGIYFVNVTVNGVSQTTKVTKVD